MEENIKEENLQAGKVSGLLNCYMAPARVEVIGDCTLYLGDSLEIMKTVGLVDAVITDPPYSSGGMYRGDRTKTTKEKYVNSESHDFYCDFSGDNRDQRSFLAWATLVFSRAYANTKSGGVAYVFTDWRQLPTMTDAVQCGGFIWRNLVTWWKPGIRMQKGRFSASAEYIVCCSQGVPVEGEKSLQNVLKHAPVPTKDREHIAAKPVRLLEDLVFMTKEDAVILDPFMGSGTTGVAAVNLRRKFIDIEIDQHSFDISCQRIERAYKERPKLFDKLLDGGQQISHQPRFF
ncbi:site-specific DNA-methyltransferase [bacterium]|nr:site-specific DNA-methyltransferase [bacterium]